MKLLTKAILNKAPMLYANDGKDPHEVNIVAKFFTPWSNWTWYMTEYNPEDGTAYGYVDGDYPEQGYFNVRELESINGPMGLKIERDRNYKGKLSEVMK